MNITERLDHVEKTSTAVTAHLDARAEADAQAATAELWDRAGKVAKATGLPLVDAMGSVLSADPKLLAAIENAPEPPDRTPVAKAAPVGPAGSVLDARATAIAKADEIPYLTAYMRVVDLDPDLAAQVAAEERAR